jgi:hypothetical protein
MNGYREATNNATQVVDRGERSEGRGDNVQIILL